jgi:hypothetical protein
MRVHPKTMRYCTVKMMLTLITISKKKKNLFGDCMSHVNIEFIAVLTVISRVLDK